MRYSLLAVVPLFLVFGAVFAAAERDFDDHRRICPHLQVKGGGCIRCKAPPRLPRPLLTFLDVRGFDVTGVTTEIDLTFPQIKNECDCIEACLNSKETCNNYVWKFSTNTSVEIGYRTCTLCIFLPACPINNF
jgi:hypothetical protein